MRILIINPNSDTHTDSVMAVKAKALALPDVDVDVIHMNSAPKLVCSYEEQAVSIGEMVDAVKKTEDMYDAFIIACHSDPNLDLIREITSKPVIGIAEASMKIASMMGNGFAVISPSPKYHCDDLLKTIKVTKSDSNEDLLSAAKEAVQEFGVDVIVLGCANYANADAYIEKKLHVPVLDGIACALIFASGLACYYRLKS